MVVVALKEAVLLVFETEAADLLMSILSKLLICLYEVHGQEGSVGAGSFQARVPRQPPLTCHVLNIFVYLGKNEALASGGIVQCSCMELSTAVL